MTDTNNIGCFCLSYRFISTQIAIFALAIILVCVCPTLSIAFRFFAIFSLSTAVNLFIALFQLLSLICAEHDSSYDEFRAFLLH